MSDSTIPLRHCTKCGNPFPATTDYFYYNKQAEILYSWCKECHYVVSTHHQRPMQQDPLPGFRTCNKCGTPYPIQEFPKDKKSPDGISRRCTYCNRKGAGKWNKKHPERAKRRLSDWINQNRARYRQTKKANGHRRRAREIQAEGKFTRLDIQHQYDKQQGRCYWCSIPIIAFEIDHVIPITRGGANWPDNLVCSCRTCNRSKINKIPYTEWQPPNPLFPPDKS